MKVQGPVGIQVGADKMAIDAARDAILEILQAGREERTTRAALRAFVAVAETPHASISDVQITMLPAEEAPHEPAA